MSDLLKHMPDEVTALHKFAKELIDKDLDEEEITAELMKEGVSQTYAAMIIDNVLTDMRNKKDFYKLLIMSIFTITGGLLLNYMSYNTAYNSGAGFMLVFWGLVVAGIIMLVKAVAMYKQLPVYFRKKG